MRWTRERGVLGIHKTNYVVKTTELERKPRGVSGVFIFRLRLQNGAGGGMLARKIGGWRWKSADICEKEHARQVCGISRRHADGECAKRYTPPYNGAGGDEFPRCSAGA